MHVAAPGFTGMCSSLRTTDTEIIRPGSEAWPRGSLGAAGEVRRPRAPHSGTLALMKAERRSRAAKEGATQKQGSVSLCRRAWRRQPFSCGGGSRGNDAGRRDLGMAIISAEHGGKRPCYLTGTSIAPSICPLNKYHH